MSLAVGLVALLFWWAGIAAFLFVIVPVIVLIGNRVVSATRQIRAYAEDIAEHAAAVAAGLDDVTALRETGRLASEVQERTRRVVSATRSGVE